jgi:hypothetical protein
VHQAIALQLWPDIVEARRPAARQTIIAPSQVIHLDYPVNTGPERSSPAEFEFQAENNRPSPPAYKCYKRRQTAKGKTLSLPPVISNSSSSTPLAEGSVRRCSRLSANKAGFREVKIDKEPSKKRKTIPIMINKDTGKAGPVPLFMLQEWGVKCGVAPGELIEDALLQAPDPNVANDST